MVPLVLVFGVVLWLGVVTLVGALCAAAGRADRRSADLRSVRLADVRALRV